MIWWFGGLFGLIALVLAILVIIDVLNHKRWKTGKKVLWIVFAILFSIITAIVYYFVEVDK